MPEAYLLLYISYSLVPLRAKALGFIEMTGQHMPNDFLAHLGTFDHRFQIDAGFNPHLLAQKDQVFRTHIAGRMPIARG